MSLQNYAITAAEILAIGVAHESGGAAGGGEPREHYFTDDDLVDFARAVIERVAMAKVMTKVSADLGAPSELLAACLQGDRFDPAMDALQTGRDPQPEAGLQRCIATDHAAAPASAEEELIAVRHAAWNLQVEQSLFLVALLDLVTGNGHQYFTALEDERQEAILRQCSALAEDIHQNLERMQEVRP